MKNDFSEIFRQYEELALKMDKVFSQIQRQYPSEVKCELGCCDCCYAMFDLTLVEAMYLNKKFHETLTQEKKSEIYEKANRADREAFRIKRSINKEYQKGVSNASILEEVGKKRIKCPLLTEENQCILYSYRPINCRVYGIPMSINGEVHTCIHASFSSGHKYPTVYMDKIHEKLIQLSQNIVNSIPTTLPKLSEVMVPVSFAILNEYNDEYLGIVTQENSGHSSENFIDSNLLGTQGED